MTRNRILRDVFAVLVILALYVALGADVWV